MGKTRATAGARGREPTTEHKTQTNKPTMQALRTKPTKKTAAKAKPAKKPTGLPSFNFGAKQTAAKKSVAPTGPAAQSFEIRIPGQFFQARKDIVWNVSLGFTKSNELFVGRMAMLGFAASLIGEAITGKGPLAQFNMETGIPLSEAEPLLLFSIIFFALTAVTEGTGKFVDEE